MPGATEKMKLYIPYLFKMEDALNNGTEWLVGNKFSIADISMTPYINRLAMMSMRGMWENNRLPNVEKWFAKIEALPNFKKCLIDWVPDELASDLLKNGAKSWPGVAKILEIDI